MASSITSRKKVNFISLAAQEAEKSPVLMRHGAIAVSNGKILAKGHNHYRSCASTGVIEGCTCHAECDVLHKLHKKRERHPSKTKRITMYITRIGQAGELRESSPCHDCYEKMLFYGIKTIIFTTENQDTTDVEIVKYNIEDFNPSVVTTGQRFMLKTKNNEMSQ